MQCRATGSTHCTDIYVCVSVVGSTSSHLGVPPQIHDITDLGIVGLDISDTRYRDLCITEVSISNSSVS